MKNWARAAVNLLFPPLCRACDAVLPGSFDTLLCEPCRKQLVPISAPICGRCGAPQNSKEDDAEAVCRHCPANFAPIDRYRSAVVFRSPYRELIHRFKFEGSLAVRPLLTETFIQGADRFFAGRPFDVIVPVPLHWMRKFGREFNQSEILAAALAEAWQIPLLAEGLRRVRRTVPQSRLRGRWRAANIRGAFGPGSASIEGMRVLLVDDVMTSGATLRECARVMLEAGCVCVSAYTLSRRL